MAFVLVVDDEASLRTFIRIVLEHAGHQVHTAADGAEAQSKCVQNNYELIISDVYMPEKNGLEVILELARTGSGTRVIAMSGGSTIGLPNFLPESVDFGAHAILAKPFTTSQLIDKVNAVMSRKA